MMWSRRIGVFVGVVVVVSGTALHCDPIKEKASEIPDTIDAGGSDAGADADADADDAGSSDGGVESGTEDIDGSDADSADAESSDAGGDAEADAGTCANPCAQGTTCVKGICLGARQISVSEANTCAVLTDGTARCWGANGVGQLGNGTFVAATKPIDVAGMSNVKQIFTGSLGTCGSLVDGTMKCWGQMISSPAWGSVSNVPVVTSELANAQDLAQRFGVACARMGDNSAKCWGSNNLYGQVGNGTKVDAPSPVAITGLSNVKILQIGATHACALLTDETVKCWGANIGGQVGAPGPANEYLTPTPVAGLDHASELTVGAMHSCVLVTGGYVRCWGENLTGAIGNGMKTNAPTPSTAMTSGPMPPVPLTNARKVVAGSFRTCALLDDATVSCWGKNDKGQLGDGTKTDSPYALPVKGLANVADFVVGNQHSCALLADGTVRCWGDNTAGQLGDGTTVESLEPVVVKGLSNVKELVSNIDASDTCAVRTDGTVWCWGDNSSGQIGNGTLVDVPEPVEVKDLLSR